MAEEIVNATAAGAETPTVAAPVSVNVDQPAVKYTVGELKAAAKKQFSCGPEVIDGAIYGKEETSYSVAEMKTLVETFLNKPLKDGGK